MLDRNRIVSQLNTMRYERGLILGDYTASTNTKVRDMAQHGAAEGVTIIVQRQTGGRGRLGRSFHSPEGGLYLSTLLRPADPDPGQITCRAAVAAARAIESLCDAKIDIKWVNDLYLNGRKVAGILAEGVLSPDGSLTAVVLGIGINVGEMIFPDELKSIATSLGNEGFALAREDLAAAFLNEWERAYDATDPADTMAEYRRRNLVLGRQVTVMRGSETYPAAAEAITDGGHLLVRTPDGEIHELNSGEVSLRL
ncbi:MAG: biotin--[Clostridia bacterium]|nr:biotin--[acetyl-CoA-carboxylase] ligase [Clostridia bacterium]